MVEWCEFDSQVGTVFAASSDRGLCRLSFGKKDTRDFDWLEKHFKRQPISAAKIPVSSILLQVQKELEEYLNGIRREFSVTLDLKGTPFQRAVWRELRRIPAGETISYGALAARVGYPRAARAVGGAMRANPVPILVPCHRVLPADGTVGDYGGGSELKEFLLRLEGATFRQS
ncbi:MAG: methylated-DNA--[protein]-cysteine S-methyltransferase [Firmicutes bacterium]|nr:methylated-DNA--[protein]-cysteine S-methyltransferase [Bacillota bacterium]